VVFIKLFILFPSDKLIWCNLQYLKHVRLYRDIPIFERFPVLICVTIVWIYSVILTASGAYRHKPTITQNSCRTDRANLISKAPWYLKRTNFVSSDFISFGEFLSLFVFLKLIGSCSHTLSNGVHPHFLLAIHLQ